MLHAFHEYGHLSGNNTRPGPSHIVDLLHKVLAIPGPGSLGEGTDLSVANWVLPDALSLELQWICFVANRRAARDRNPHDVDWALNEPMLANGGLLKAKLGSNLIEVTWAPRAQPSSEQYSLFGLT